MGFIDWGMSLVSKAIDVCTSIGSTVMRSASSFIMQMPPLWPTIVLLECAIRIIGKVAELIIGKPEQETPEEMGMKAEYAELKPEDFNFFEDYMDYLRNEIQIDKQRITELSAEERHAYALVGTSMYVKQAEEKYSLELSPEFWKSVEVSKLTPEQTVSLIEAMSQKEIGSAKKLSDYLNGDLKSAKECMNIYSIITDFIQKNNSNMSNEDITQAISDWKDHCRNQRF